MPSPSIARAKAVALVLAGMSVLVGCAAPAGGGAGERSAAPGPTGPKGTLRLAWAGEPPSLGPKFVSPGGTAFNELAITFNSALTYYDPSGSPIPQIAREVPSVDNGSWVVNPDGTMVTTYHLRPAKWHDGVPLTASDFAFAYRVYANPQVPLYRRDPGRYISALEAPDEGTLVINWAQPYYHANALRYTQMDPLPAHILADVYQRD